MKKTLVTGGAGFIGSTLTRALLERGRCDRVVVVDSLLSGHEQNLAGLDPGVEFHNCDIRDYADLAGLFAGVDTVYHQAAVASVPRSLADPQFCFEINVGGAHNVMRAAVEHGVRRLVFASSSAIYGDSEQLPKHEQMAPEPKSPYGAHKLAVEYLLASFQASFGLETVSLRYFNVFGPRQDPSSPYSGVLSIFADRALQSAAPKVYGDGEQSRDFIFVDDVAELNLLAGSTPAAAGKIFNGGTGQRVSLNQAWQAMRRAAGIDLEVLREPERRGDVRHSQADISLARAVLGFEPKTSFEEGIRRTFEWRREADQRAES